MYWTFNEVSKGQSGTAIFTKHAPLSERQGIVRKEIDIEGRTLTLEYKDFFLVTCYAPNSGNPAKPDNGKERFRFRTEVWDTQFYAFINKLKKKKNVIVAGDFNVAHRNIDIYDHKGKELEPGFTKEERGNFDDLLRGGWVDTFRKKNPNLR